MPVVIKKTTLKKECRRCRKERPILQATIGEDVHLVCSFCGEII